MANENSQHDWQIVNVRNGYLVTERCVETGARQSFFTTEDNPPIDNYTNNEGTWKYLGSAQAVKFDLQCINHKKTIQLNNVVGLMLCTECDKDCNAGQLAEIVNNTKTWIYVALSEDTSSKKGRKIMPEETRTLTEYFNGRLRTPGKKILFVPDNFIKNIDTCRGEIIADIGMTDIY